ncbi:hypothetical protein JTE90_029322 [Oedothorax gibbosus]|uniref:Uncharacterized protein n=1 Tax=Oedothorax gibbosus TaxID=931172 RepID=A0AAV6UJN9_9ARAC|nr:hypothetical protein JTE90_029322 [Oedothorax gibbosus]
MSGNKKNKNSVAGVPSKRFTKKEKRQRSTSSSSSSKKCKLTQTSQSTDQISSVYSLSNNKDSYLASTQRWKELLLNNETRNGLLARSEEIYRENVTQLLKGLDDFARNPAKWSRQDTNLFYCKIISFIVNWKKQLLKENTCDLINNRFNLLTSFSHELSTVMKFSETQRNVIDCKVKELNDVRSELAKRGQFLSSQSSLTTQLKNNDPELSAARQQSDDCCEEPIKLQNSLKEAHLNFNESSLEKELSKNKHHEQNEASRQQADTCFDELKPLQNCLKGKVKSRVILRVDPQAIIDVCLQEKEKQLNELKKQLDWAAKKQKETEVELKKQLDWAAKKQKETEGELAETREQLQSFVSKSREMTQTKQKEMNRKLYDIETSLLMKNPNYRPSCEIVNESLNKEEKIFKNIKAVIEYESNSAKSDNEQNTTESALENNSSSLRVSEYEVHIVTLIAAILKITPFPLSSQSIYSYVVKIDNVVDLQFVERLMRKFPSFFKEVAGEPGSMEKYWTYLDLKPVITI